MFVILFLIAYEPKLILNIEIYHRIISLCLSLFLYFHIRPFQIHMMEFVYQQPSDKDMCNWIAYRNGFESQNQVWIDLYNYYL